MTIRKYANRITAFLVVCAMLVLPCQTAFAAADTKAPTVTRVKTNQTTWTKNTLVMRAVGVKDASGVSSVRAAVWSSVGGQDDLRWYYLKKSGNDWLGNAFMKDFKASGLYHIHFYATDKKGNDGFIGAINKTMKRDTASPTAKGITATQNPVTTPTVGLHVQGLSDPSGVASARIAVWSSIGQQADVKWYTLSKRDGYWAVNINMKDFYMPGEYIVHAYAKDKLGNDGIAASGTFTANPEVLGGYKIMGSSNVTAARLESYYKRSGGWAWNSSAYGGLTLRQFCQLYVDYCKAEGVKTEVAFAQMCHETNYLKYGNLVTRDQLNFAGLGSTGAVDPATGIAQKGIYFSSVQNGVLSQVQHLKAYASTASLNLPMCPEYNRFNLISRGCAPSVQALSTRWAVGPTYGFQVLSKIEGILKT